MKRIYADYAATAPMLTSAIQEYCQCASEDFGNPSSLHTYGQSASSTLRQARNTISALLGCDSNELVFTSGGTEADNQALEIARALGRSQGKKEILVSAVEHHAMLNKLSHMEDITPVILPVDHNGVVSPQVLSNAISASSIMASVMFVNNELGTIEPIAALGQVCHDHGILFHTDAVQAVGHIPICLSNLPVDMLSLSGHKFGGPKGVGALYIRKDVAPVSLIYGGPQERGLRAGTENVPGIAAMAAALKETCLHMEKNSETLIMLRSHLEDLLLQIPGVTIHASDVKRSPSISSIGFHGIRSSALLIFLDMSGIAVSAGSACSSKSASVSHVLKAIGLSDEDASATIRISLGPEICLEDIDTIYTVIRQFCSKFWH